jgi:hypothetical protein
VQALLAVGNCLSQAQVKLLLDMTTAPPSGQLAVPSLGRSLQQRATSLFGKHSKNKGRAEITASQRITGIASDLQTRSLVLILGHTTIWHGLSVMQQGQLQSQIAQFLGCETLSREISEQTPPVTAAFMTQPLKSLGANLLQPLRSIASWVKARLLTGWPQRRQTLIRTLPAAVENLLPDQNLAAVVAGIAQSKQVSQKLVAVEVSAARPDIVNTDLVTTKVPDLAQRVRKIVTAPAARSGAMEVCRSDAFDGLDADYLEADVLAVDYIEHPLEKLLKWVDRVLLWFEQWLDRWLGKWFKRS